MALIAPNGQYVRVVNLEPMAGNIICERWETLAHKNAGATMFWKPVIETYTVNPTIIFQWPVDLGINLKNNTINAAYAALKTLAVFSGYTDDAP